MSGDQFVTSSLSSRSPSFLQNSWQSGQVLQRIWETPYGILSSTRLILLHYALLYYVLVQSILYLKKNSDMQSSNLDSSLTNRQQKSVKQTLIQRRYLSFIFFFNEVYTLIKVVCYVLKGLEAYWFYRASEGKNKMNYYQAMVY